MRILLAPHEICGQMQLLAEAFRARGHDATAANYAAPGPREYRTDIELNLDAHRSRAWKSARMTAFFTRAAAKYDVFHFFFGRSLLPRLMDLPLLRRMGKRIVVHFRGSDIRQQKYVNRVIKKRLLAPSDDRGSNPEIDASSPSQQRLLTTWRRYADHLFVSIPELLDVAPDAHVVQQAIDLAHWEYRRELPPADDEEIVIAHAPTNRLVKGTEYVVNAVEQLQRVGYRVRLQMLQNIPHKKIAAVYRDCHLGVDELLQGSYGNAAIELMAMGKPVIANLGPWYETHRPELPILHATPADIYERLKHLLENRDQWGELGSQGRSYVQQWHDVGVMVEQLLEFYRGDPVAAPKTAPVKEATTAA